MNLKKLNQYKEWLRKMDIFLHGDYSIPNTVTFYSDFNMIPPVKPTTQQSLDKGE